MDHRGQPPLGNTGEPRRKIRHSIAWHLKVFISLVLFLAPLGWKWGPGDAVGACPWGSTVEGEHPYSFISQPGVWYRADRFNEAIPIQPYPMDDERAFLGDYTVVGGDRSAISAISSPVTRLTMNGIEAKQIRAILTGGGEVFVHSSEDSGPTHVAFAVAFRGNDFAFLGECEDRLLTSPMRSRFGVNASRTMRDMVGKPSTGIAPLFVDPPSPPSIPILEVGSTPEKILNRLVVAGVVLADPPLSWLGDYRICTHVSQGWNSCVHLASAASATVPLTMYFDPENPSVDIWLIDAAADDLSDPTVRLARARLRSLAAASHLNLLSDPVDLVVRLSNTVSAADVIKDPSRAAEAIASLELVRSG